MRTSLSSQKTVDITRSRVLERASKLSALRLEYDVMEHALLAELKAADKAKTEATSKRATTKAVKTQAAIKLQLLSSRSDYRSKRNALLEIQKEAV